MITYVNTVLVSNASGAMVSSLSTSTSDAGKFVMLNADTNALITTAADAAAAKRIKLGVVNPDGKIKWTNVIVANDVKSLVALNHSSYTASEDTVTIDLSGASKTELVGTNGHKRIVVRLTFKDLPTRYRAWSESYEYVTKATDTLGTIATGIANVINNQTKRARVTAVATTTSGSEKVVLTAMPYDDDNSVDSINWANKVRFNVNVWFTDPDAPAFASRNKYFPAGLKITKAAGVTYPAAAKLVRDREAQAMGYLGILNHGNGTWPIVQPAMVTDLSKTYDAITLEFENMYRAADDIFRKTKQTVEIYATSISTVFPILKAFVDQPTILQPEVEEN